MERWWSLDRRRAHLQVVLATGEALLLDGRVEPLVARGDLRLMAAYAELHAHSGFSFLDGASDPEELAAEGARLGLSGLALTDHHGLYGVVRFAEAARAFGLATIFGSEVTLDGERRPRRACTTPRASTSWCWRARPRATAASPRCSARRT